MIILGIDTSNSPLSVALVKDGAVLIEETANLKVNHSLTAMPVIERLLERASLKPADLTHIAAAEGPGSYTGVRIGMTIAKTLAWSLKIPLIPVSSLQVLAANGRHFPGVICPLIDARRGTVFGAVYEPAGLRAVVEDGHYELTELLHKAAGLDRPVLFTGIDAGLHKETIQQVLGERAQFAEPSDELPHASKLIGLALQLPEVSAHEAVPEYRRLAEAEAKYLKSQKGNQS